MFCLLKIFIWIISFLQDVIEHQLFTLLENSKSNSTKSFMVSFKLTIEKKKISYTVQQIFYKSIMILEELIQFLNLPISVFLIHQILEELKQTNEKDCCRICENLLEKLTSQKDCLFVVTYMIEHLTGVLTEERVDVLHQTQIGCEVSSCQHTYPHPHPLFLHIYSNVR